MKFTGHYIITVFIALIVGVIFDFRTGLIIGLAHFIPSIDWILKRIDIFFHHHRSLFHNVFVVPLSYILFFWLTKSQAISLFCALSTSIHIFLDYIDIKGRGVALLYPFSRERYKVPLMSEVIEDIIIDGAMLGTIIVCIMLVV